MTGEALKDQWRSLDHRTHWRLRRAAWKGSELDDPKETALVGYFAREQLRLSRVQVVMHVLVFAGLLASLALNLSRGGNGLAFVYAGLLVFDIGVLGFTLRTRGRLRRAVQRVEHAVSGQS